MKLLEQFISQTGRQPADWTEQDIQEYIEYVKTHARELTVLQESVDRVTVAVNKA